LERKGISIINEGDLRTDKEELKKLSNLLAERSKLKADLRNQWMIENKKFPGDLTDNDKVLIDKYIEENIEIKKAVFDAKINDFKEQYKEENWNAEKFDLALAIVGESPDTLLGNIEYNSFSIWATYAKPIFKNKGQFLIGINYQNYYLNDEMYSSFSLSNRNYFGSNRIKGFIEEQVEHDSRNKGTNLL
jgi:hypothetical protein